MKFYLISFIIVAFYGWTRTSAEKLSVCKTLDIKPDQNGSLKKQCLGQTVFLGGGKAGPKGDLGPQGPVGPRGDKGEPGSSKIDGNFQKKIEDQINHLQQAVNVNSQKDPSLSSLQSSCADAKKNNSKATNGLYYLRNKVYNTKYLTYCDMSVDGGGWTLVATVHENDIKTNGRCSPGDKWSSESGNLPGSQQGAEAWSNRVTFGQVISATSDDYKNDGYFDLTAKNIMIWQVMDDTPLPEYYSNAYLRYYTTDNFLIKYGGNLFQLYKKHFPIKSGVYEPIKGNGPAVPITYDKGNNAELLSHYGSLVRQRLNPGYIQFRAVNHEKSAYALCPGTKGKSNNGNVEHRCIGSTSDNADKRYCGDFAAFVFDQYGTGTVWNTDKTLLKTTFMIFYR